MLKNQLLTRKTISSLDFIGSTLKFIAGTSKHDNLIEIKEQLNAIISNNYRQRVMNSNFEKLLKQLTYKHFRLQMVLQEVHKELLQVDLTTTINFARKNLSYSAAINVKEVQRVLEFENTDIAVIDVLECSEVFICRNQDTFVVINKYHLLKEKCETLTTLSYNHGKLLLDPLISRLNTKYTHKSDTNQDVKII